MAKMCGTSPSKRKPAVASRVPPGLMSILPGRETELDDCHRFQETVQVRSGDKCHWRASIGDGTDGSFAENSCSTHIRPHLIWRSSSFLFLSFCIVSHT